MDKRTFTADEVKEIIRLHHLWILGDAAGKRADFSNADLRSADLTSADLRSADLRAADLRSANLRAANLTYADLTSADLRSANLRAADLTSADLTYANLTSADLTYADLRSANLRAADLRSADLTSADLRSADLTSADLTYANLTSADLTYANLRSANLRAADLTPIKADVWMVLCSLPAEVPALRAALAEGRVNGSAYEGKCACLLGTLANAKGCRFDELATVKADSDRPAERFFMLIAKGDTPETNQASAIALTWVDEWLSLMRAVAAAGAFAPAPSAKDALTEGASV